MLELNTLLCKDDHMYEIYQIKKYKYRNEHKVKYYAYEVSSISGLIYKSNNLSIKESDLYKFTILAWKWR